MSAVLPRDDDGFTVSFAPEDAEGIQAFFDEHGVVVVRDVLSPAAVEASLDELWAEMLAATDDEGVDRGDPGTWGGLSPALSTSGILTGPVSMGEQAWAVRQNEALAGAFAAVMRQPASELLASVDRKCFMRPTGGQGRPEWRTQGRWFHWDTNPRAAAVPDADTTAAVAAEFADCFEVVHEAASAFVLEWNATHHPDYVKTQGLVALLDSRDDTGGFTCVPGFQRELAAYLAGKEGLIVNDSFVMVPRGDQALVERAEKVTMRAGSAVIWSGALPHCNYASEGGEAPRACQYVKFAPRWLYPPQVVAARARVVRQLQPAGFSATGHGERVFGFS